jgi:hypothetical protein
MKICKKGLHQYEGIRCIECKRLWDKSRPEYKNLLHKKWRESNPELNKRRIERSNEKRRAITKEWKKNNSEKVNALNAKRRALKVGATPSWLSVEQLKDIEQFYMKAKELSYSTGIEHHVDHIIPLAGNNICGLHVPWNLQILTQLENCRKSNKF